MRRLAAPLLAAWLSAAPSATAAELVHGADSTFAARGVVVLWAVLRGADEASTAVVLRVMQTGRAHGAIAVDGIDPFNCRRIPVALPAELGAQRDLRIPRAWFAQYPRTEIHLAPAPEDLAAGRPALTIYFTGVPDTTPELATAAALETYFETALARTRGR
jgi:hypothetical protein